MRYYDDIDSAPVVLGRTPLNHIAYPRGFTRIQLDLPGKRTAEDLIWNFPLIGDTWGYRLTNLRELPEDMVAVPAGKFELYMPGLDHLKAEQMAAFLMDRHEVTNQDYKRFLDAGGYTERKYWKYPFVDKGRKLSWDEGVRRFVDRTGRPGPSTWEVGSYTEGHEQYPVAGVSWYEAAAYAEWAGKRLPTIFHWNRVAFTVASSRIIPLSNLSGKGLVPVGRRRA